MYATTANDQVVAIRFRQQLDEGDRLSPFGEPTLAESLEVAVEPLRLKCFSDFKHSRNLQVIIHKIDIVGEISFNRRFFKERLEDTLLKRELKIGDEVVLESRPDTWFRVGELVDDSGVFNELQTVQFMLHRSDKPTRIN